MNVQADTSRTQAFLVLIYNDSDVTQTILRLADDSESNPSPTKLMITLSREGGWAMSPHVSDYAKPPFAVAPHTAASIRFETDNCVGPGTFIEYDSVDLKVKVGMFTRTEHIDFGDTSFVLHGNAKSKHC